MKTMKKLLALALVLVFALSMTAVAFAAPATGSITIQDSNTVSVSGKTFAAYKILDATLVDPTDANKGIAYSVPAELVDFYSKRYSIPAEDAEFDAKVYAKVAAETDRFAFAAAALAAAKAANVTPVTKTANGDVTQVTIDNLPFGYYVVEDQGAKAPISALMLDTTKPDTFIKIKASMPTIDKKIDGANDTDPATKNMVESNSASIGDKVPYVLTSKVPDMTGYKKYFFVVNDKLSKGLTFNNDVVINVNGEVLSKSSYTVTATDVDGATHVEIIFKDFYNNFKEKAGQDIVIKYSATVNENAVIGTLGNPNEVTLDYSSNPNIDAKGDPSNPDKPGPEDKENGVIGTTPKEITKTFVTGVIINKIDEDGKHLAGAEFEIKGERINQVIVEKDVFTLDNEKGTYYLLKDGTYTKTLPSPENQDQYASQTDKYTLKHEREVITTSEEVTAKGTVGTDGILRFDGLGAGKYIITEIKAPNGYNKLKDPIEITITCKLPATGTDNCTWSVEGGKATMTEDGNRVTLDIVNKTGSLLPSTGGMGTTILYVVGGILVVGAAILLFVKKRTSAAK